MDDLVEWLRQQLDEDERVALASGAEPWNFYPDGHYDAVRKFLDRWNPVAPDAVLADIRAKQRIVNSFAAGMEAQPLRRGTESYAIVRMVLKLLALPYSDRPGYREEWRP